MLHLLLYGLLAILVAVGLFFLAARFLPAGEQIAPPVRDEPPWDLPAGALSPDEIDAVRLPVALRGYRFAETDILLDRLAGELRARDEEIARLRGPAPVRPRPGAQTPGGAAPADDGGSADDADYAPPRADDPAAPDTPVDGADDRR